MFGSFYACSSTPFKFQLSYLSMSNYRLILSTVLSSFISALSFAGELHQHIEVNTTNQRVQVNFCRPERGCSLVKPETLGLPPGQLPLDKLTGTAIYVSEFTAFPNGIAIDSPGFEAIAGDLNAGDRVRYIASSRLSFWNTDQRQWSLAPEGIRIRLAGGLDLQPDQTCGQVFCLPKAIEGFTLFDRHGVAGTSSLIVGEARPDGSLHTHLDWILETEQGSPNGPVGAYLVELSILTDAYPTPSAPFWIMFNHDLPITEFQQAVADRVLKASIDTTLADKLFDWAESNYPSLFPNKTTSFIAVGYYARCYQNGICVGVRDNSVLAIGGEFGPNIANMGEFTSLLKQAGF